jgi:hypothetical protein
VCPLVPADSGCGRDVLPVAGGGRGRGHRNSISEGVMHVAIFRCARPREARGADAEGGRRVGAARDVAARSTLCSTLIHCAPV